MSKSECPLRGSLLVLIALSLPLNCRAQTAETPAGGWQGVRAGEWSGGEGVSPGPGRFHGNRYVPPAGQPVYRPLEEDDREGMVATPGGGASPTRPHRFDAGSGFVPSGYGEGTPPGPLPEDLAVPTPWPEEGEPGGWNRSSDTPGVAWGRGGEATGRVAPRWEGEHAPPSPAYPPRSVPPTSREGGWRSGESDPAYRGSGVQDYSGSSQMWRGGTSYEERRPWAPGWNGYYPPRPDVAPYWTYPERPPATGYRFPGGWFGLPGATWTPPWEGSGWSLPGWGRGGYPAADSYPYGYEPGYYGYDRGYLPREYPPGYGYGQTGRW